MSSHSECSYNGCSDCSSDGWVGFARHLLALRVKLVKEKHLVIWPDEMEQLILKTADEETLREQG